jgi:hypothetical protein
MTSPGELLYQLIRDRQAAKGARYAFDHSPRNGRVITTTNS